MEHVCSSLTADAHDVLLGLLEEGPAPLVLESTAGSSKSVRPGLDGCSQC